jgi:DNA-binding CsgD family transcriptional regulator
MADTQDNRDLSPQEREVARRVAKAMTIQEIADDMGLKFNTVKKYLDRIRDKLAMRRKSQIALWAQANLKDEDDDE